MSYVLAEGGYQAFDLSGTDTTVLLVALLVALGALAVAFVMMRGVLAADDGSTEMTDISDAIHEGAMAYITRQFRTIAVIVVPLAAVVFLTSTSIDRIDGAEVVGFFESGLFRTLAFLVGGVFSGAIGFLGMWLATKANVRTTAAAVRSDFAGAFLVAFRTGGVVGLATAGLALLGATGIILLFQNFSSAILIGFGFGGSLLALFLRVGGGIFTKAADVGADLVGKVEAGIPEDDPRNPATIADNVGDNVGDCAGMAADLFESSGVVLVASIILGVTAFEGIGLGPDVAARGLVFPVGVMAIGLVASVVGLYLAKARAGEDDALKIINRGISIAQAIAIVGAALLAFAYVGNPDGATISQPGARMFGAIVVGVALGFAASRITAYYTSTTTKPVQDIAKASRTGPATTVLEGISSGLESAVWGLVAVAVAIGGAIALGGGSFKFSTYLVALAGIGMLSTTGIIVAEDTFGPVADNSAGIAEMTGDFEGEPERIMVSLDAVGNTTKAVTKGFAIGSAVIAAVALFASYGETIIEEIAPPEALLVDASYPINVADPKVFIGLLVGGSIAFIFSSLAIRAVSRTAGVVVQEVRRQFADGKIMSGERKPDYGPAIDICTTASLRELATPALIAVLTPVIIGFGLGPISLGAFLASVIVVGQLMANFLSNAGGAWDNAKKYIEDGAEGGKGSEPHKAAVIGDTVGDPFKDTAGPALNPLIKVMNLVSLLILPAIIGFYDEDALLEQRQLVDPAGIVIAVVAAVVVIGAIAYSKGVFSRGASTIETDPA
ncbi:sodium-translocating pyrophosphatase [Iamia majanohamensis]|uniref:K(+)-insensitive pyrophosphate-energized proton pump n=1 Tax=Iamia majanohamensis TaxID=467976 RepID=A0AAE9YGR3_9ACTN|nr:sodium-translocating pyrophosphatase [Iamia majanohamensis]WCO67481.1 sodium-translocating pyrophosphatase [Iamia majanohamensis]